MFDKLWEYYTKLGNTLCKLTHKLKEKPEGEFNEVIGMKLNVEQYKEIDKESKETNKNSSTNF